MARAPQASSLPNAPESCHDFTRSLVEFSDNRSLSKADLLLYHPHRQTSHSAFAVQGTLHRLPRTVLPQQFFNLAWRQGAPDCPTPLPHLLHCPAAAISWCWARRTEGIVSDIKLPDNPSKSTSQIFQVTYLHSKCLLAALRSRRQHHVERRGQQSLWG